MKKLRFLCFASLLVLILALSVASDAPLAAEEDPIISTTPTTLSTSEAEEEPPACSATITITWTTAVPPEE